MNVSSHGVIEDTFQGFCPPLSMHGNEAPGRYFNQATRRRCTTQRPGWYQLKCLRSQNHTWRCGLTARTFTSHRRQWIIFSATHCLYRSDSALTWGKKTPQISHGTHRHTHTHVRRKTKQNKAHAQSISHWPSLCGCRGDWWLRRRQTKALLRFPPSPPH